MPKKGVTVQRPGDRILATVFLIAKDLPPGTISRAWAAKYLKE